LSTKLIRTRSLSFPARPTIANDRSTKR
jgi:hypothetical protein